MSTETMIGGIPLETAERFMDSSARHTGNEVPGSAYRGSTETTPDGAPAREFTHGVIEPTAIPVNLTREEWSAIHWLIVEQSTMVWTMGRQLRDPELRKQGVWWKDLEARIADSVDDMIIGPINVIVKDAMDATRPVEGRGDR